MPNHSREKQTAPRLSNDKMNQITRESICRAMLLLLKEKDFQSISITELTQTAGVSRNGFYRNYEAKEDILNELIATLHRGLSIAIGPPVFGKGSIEWYHQFFSVLRSQSGTLLRLMEAGAGNEFLRMTSEQLLKSCPEASPEERYRLLAWNGALQNIAHDWLFSGMKESDEKMALLCSGLLYSF